MTFFIIELITLGLMSCTLEQNNNRKYRNHYSVLFFVIHDIYFDILQPPKKHFLNAGTKKIKSNHDI